MKSVKNLRKWHRWLGLCIGIQFLAWTLSGLYFSWTSIDEIHGDLTFKPIHTLELDSVIISPNLILNQLKEDAQFHGIKSVELTTVFDETFYRVIWQNHEMRFITELYHAKSGKKRAELTKEEAKKLAIQSFSVEAQPTESHFIDESTMDLHHEYRESPLPAWRIDFNHPSETHVYVSVDRAQVMKHRNGKWRWFDWLWMLHTMDYETRDDINNWLLRMFSAVGLITVLSGFWLFFETIRFNKVK